MTIYDPYERADKDFYIEPAEAVERLIAAERFVGTVLDPACGTGTIPKAFKGAGHYVSGMDIVERCEHKFPFTAVDFLESNSVNIFDDRFDNIVSNPPYNLAEEFLMQSLRIARHKVAFLLRLAFLEGQGRAKRVFNGKTPLKTVHVFPDRVCMPPGDMLLNGDAKRQGGKHAFAWFVWEQGYDGRPEIRWL